jgi:threonine dehydratase
MSDPLWGEVFAARKRIAPFVHNTPIMTCAALDRIAGKTACFKCENLQKTGSFKFRGALNAVSSLPNAEQTRGVITHSSGNHGQALALAARLYGMRATVVMPENAPVVKREATEGYGAAVILCRPTQAAREERTERVIRKTGAVFIDSHDDGRVIAGQGTAAVELIEDAGPFDTILVPVGGGGLLAGTAIAVSHLLPNARVIGCEPFGADDAYRSLRSGERMTEFTPETIADGLRTPLGERNFEIISALVHDIVRVSEEEILAAMRFIWERMKIVIEPSSAVAVAPLLAHFPEVTGKRIGVILSGGNVDLDRFFRLLSADVAC